MGLAGPQCSRPSTRAGVGAILLSLSDHDRASETQTGPGLADSDVRLALRILRPRNWLAANRDSLRKRDTAPDEPALPQRTPADQLATPADQLAHVESSR